MQPYRECHFLLNEECSPNTIEYVSKAQLWWRTYSPTKTCLLCCIRNVLTAIPDCYRYTDFCNRTSHMLPVVFRIQFAGIVSIVFSTECVSISFAQTTLVLFAQFTLHNYVIYVNIQWSWDKMAAIFQTTLPNAFSWMKMFEYRLRFHRSLFISVQLIIFQHWFR